MLRLLLLSSLLLSPALSRTCDCSQYSLQQEHSEDKLDWLNGFLASWYDINSDNLLDFVNDILREQVLSKIPGVVSSLTLTTLKLAKTPAISLVSSTSSRVVCDDVRFRKYTMYVDLNLDNPGVLAKGTVKLLFGASVSVSVEDAFINGIVRMEALMSSGELFPGFQDVKITFLDRPKVDFDVKLNEVTALKDTKAAATKPIPYPSMVVLDLSPLSRHESIKTVTINHDPDLSPAVMSSTITIEPFGRSAANRGMVPPVEVRFEHGDGQVEKNDKMHQTGRMIQSGKLHKFDVFMRNYENSKASVKIIERKGAASDVMWAEMDVDVLDMLRSGSMQKTVSKIHREENASWKVTIDLWSYPLPPVYMVGNKLLPSLFSQTQCTDSGEYGVLYLSIHRASNFSSPPVITVLLDGKEIMKTGPVPDSEIDKKVEILMQNDGKQLSDHVVEFQASAGASNLGKTTVTLKKILMLNEAVPVSEGRTEKGKIYVSLIFRPVPFM